MEDATDDAEALEDRLRRLAERRRVAARLTHRTSSSEGEPPDEPAPRLPQGSALQALRAMLQERQAALQEAGTGLARTDGSASACQQAPTHSSTLVLAPASMAAAPFDSSHEAQMAPATLGSLSASSDGGGSGPPSVPATARALILLGSVVEQQEAHAVRWARTAEAREAENAVREAEVSLRWRVCRRGSSMVGRVVCVCVPARLPCNLP